MPNSLERAVALGNFCSLDLSHLFEPFRTAVSHSSIESGVVGSCEIMMIALVGQPHCRNEEVAAGIEENRCGR